MTTIKILIVEDELLIADTISRHLEKKGYEVIGTAISHKEALSCLEKGPLPDLVLLDIRLSGVETGIDTAKHIRSENLNIPFVFLTSQIDDKTLTEAKNTFPAGYLSKPVQKETLFSTLEIALHNHRFLQQTQTQEKHIQLQNGNEHFSVPVSDIYCFAAEHVYIKLYLKGRSPFLMRKSLRELLESLPIDKFMQVHRSFAVNIAEVHAWTKTELKMKNELIIPIGKAYKEKVVEILEK